MHAPAMPPVFPLHGVIFDLDGTLVDTERVSEIAWRQAQAETGVALPQGFYETLIGQSARDSHRRLLEVIDTQERVLLLMQSASRHYIAALEHGPVPLKPGVGEFLDFLDSRAIPYVLATSSERHHAELKLHGHGLFSRFRGLVCGNEVAVSKPHPEIFQRALRLLGVEAPRCLVIEDSPNGVRGAHAAGIPVALIPDVAVVTDEVRRLSWRVFTDLPHLLDHLQKQPT